MQQTNKKGVEQHIYQNLNTGERKGEPEQKSRTASFRLPTTITSTHSSDSSDMSLPPPLLIPLLLSLPALMQLQFNFTPMELELHPANGFDPCFSRVLGSERDGNEETETRESK